MNSKKFWQIVFVTNIEQTTNDEGFARNDGDETVFA